MRVTLGFDTSCYTTSAAAVDEHGTVVAAERMLLPVREGQRGLRQSEAACAANAPGDGGIGPPSGGRAGRCRVRLRASARL